MNNLENLKFSIKPVQSMDNIDITNVVGQEYSNESSTDKSVKVV